MLIKLGLRYGSEKCLEFTERLLSTYRDEAYKTSIYLSRDRGAFPEFNSRKYLNQEFAKTLPSRIRMLIKRFGIRNAVMLTMAPTGTTSMVMGVSSGIEPIFSPMYKRRFRFANTWKEEIVLDPLFKKWVEDGMPIEHFVGAYDVSPEDHMAVQATFQTYVDNAISKTINLPKEAKAEDLIDLALSYAGSLKGLTIYRAGSKGQEPLEAIPTTPENIKKYVLNIEDVKEEVADGAVCRIGDGSCG
jgi:ribonucleoside-diphosphate reductase alpha chain